jgi:hypothetical protein
MEEANMARKKGKTGITDKHYLDLAQAWSAQTTLTAYGKLIKNSETLPSAAGISHPYGLTEPLQASVVYGVEMGGSCIPLPSPVQVMLPAPDGPADRCGWDPAEYVVWKNLPRNWVTTHFEVRTRTLSSALLAGDPARLALAITGVRDRVLSVLKIWAKLPTDPDDNDELQTLWDFSKPGGSFHDGAQILAGDLNKEFGTHFRVSDFDPPSSIKTVDQLVNAIP